MLLRHPNYHPPGGESKLVYHPPVMNCSTAAYEDVDKVLDRVRQELIVAKGMKAVLIVGDQQSFGRMWHLKVHFPDKFAWVIPCSGDFHYQFHIASGINRVAYSPILKWFIDSADMSKTVKRKMDDTVHMKYIDHFYQLVIKSILTYLTDVYGHEYMAKKPSVLLVEKKKHQGERGGGGGGGGEQLLLDSTTPCVLLLIESSALASALQPVRCYKKTHQCPPVLTEPLRQAVIPVVPLVTWLRGQMSKHLIQHLQPTRTHAVHYVYISGFCILVRFLHELLLPWFAVRNGIRCNDHKTLDWSWSYFLPLFRATNKHQYAAYAVQQAATVHMMCSDVRKVWNEHRTASMTGRPGRNVAWDYVLEKMNLNFKQYLHDHITEERLHDFGIMINALKHIRKQFEQAWRHGAGDPDDEEDHGEYSHVKDADVKVIVDALKEHLGGNVQEANHASTNVP